MLRDVRAANGGVREVCRYVPLNHGHPRVFAAALAAEDSRRSRHTLADARSNLTR